MMHGNDFDGAAEFSGGGFVRSQATQTVDPLPSALSKHRDTQTLIPLTVKQIIKAMPSKDDKVNFLIDGVDCNNVKLVGMMINKVERVTDISFVIDDGTGRVECNRWTHEQIDTKEMESILEGMYVRVHGQLKSFQGKKQLVVFGIKPVTDFDEITHHFVECIYVHSYNTKLVKQQPSSSNQAYMPSSYINTQTYQTAPPNQVSYTGHPVADTPFTEVDRRVLDYLLLPACRQRETGVHQDELVSQLNIPLHQILASLNSLTEEGVVYTALDEHHFKSTANG
ncbi:replication protein A 32 kDa subunit B-like [Bidens hawaiensis]|uniref:replication protein A 32 kDa subunit B-like n=1 Tax=Bidens hawaiensis TaxID=980011 RepID=UPI00404AB83C